MDIRGSNGFIESFLSQKLLAPPVRQTAVAPIPQSRQQNGPKDVISVGTATESDSNAERLISETQEQTDDGIRVTQEFESSDGRTFTRIQDFSITDRGFERDVIQQNPSGSTTRLQEVLDRQDNGLFRQTLRFTDTNGVSQTRIENDFVSLQPFVLSNGQSADAVNQNSPFEVTRGTRLDLEA